MKKDNKIIDKKNKKEKIKKEDSPKKKNIKFTILAIICIIIYAISISPVTLQNDTFYTIKIGEDIIKDGKIDMLDHYSIHHIPYTYPHWAYDVLIYLFYSIGGMTGVYISTLIFASILGIILYFLNLKLSKNKPISLFFAIGEMYLLSNFVAARAQLVTFSLFALTILLIESFLEKKKISYALGIIAISIAIANLHCAVWPFFFVIFLPYIVEYIIFTIFDMNLIYKFKMKINRLRINLLNKKINKLEDGERKDKLREKIKRLEIKNESNIENNKIFIEKRDKRRENPYKIKYNKNKNVKWLILIMLICALTGLITPLGDTPYTYLYKTMKGNTTDSISEHQPLTLFNNKEIMYVLASLLAILIFTDTKLTLKDVFFIGGLILLMFMTRRQTSLFVLLVGPIIATMVSDIFSKYDKKGLEKLENIILSVLGAIATILFIILLSVIELKPKLDDKYVSEYSYPVNAVEYIKENLDYKNIRLFNEYNYGSYLLLNDIPVFIDSRADLYAPEFNGHRASTGKYIGKDIFSEYMQVSGLSKSPEKLFKKYDLTHIILNKRSKLNKIISKDKDRYIELYSDKRFVIYEIIKY